MPGAKGEQSEERGKVRARGEGAGVMLWWW